MLSITRDAIPAIEPPRFPIYNIHYGTPIRSDNSAVVSAGSPNRATSFLEEYLLKHPFNPKYPKSSMPNRIYQCRKAGDYTSQKEGVIFCSFG